MKHIVINKKKLEQVNNKEDFTQCRPVVWPGRKFYYLIFPLVLFMRYSESAIVCSRIFLYVTFINLISAYVYSCQFVGIPEKSCDRNPHVHLKIT